MPESVTDHYGAESRTHRGSLFASSYAPGQERPPGSYAVLAGVYEARSLGRSSRYVPAVASCVSAQVTVNAAAARIRKHTLIQLA